MSCQFVYLDRMFIPNNLETLDFIFSDDTVVAENTLQGEKLSANHNVMPFSLSYFVS